MAKLPKEYQFVDLSDYGRPIACWIANAIKHTSITPLHVTTWFIISGIIAVICIIFGYPVLAALFLIIKSILDAADGELARIKNSPSYTGRYYDSIADIILNFFFLLSFRYISDGSYFYMILSFIGLQLQGTLYNYYYVILRNSVNGDTTSRVFEDSIPRAMKGESQTTVNIFYTVYNYLYIAFDKTIYHLDKHANKSKPFPKWFMSLLSTFGLGFQLLIMALMLIFKLEHLVIPFFIGFSILIPINIGIRKYILQQ